VQSVQRALRVLKLLASSSEPIGVRQIGRELSLHRATVSRLLGTLLAEGFVSQERATQRYAVGPAFLSAAVASGERLRLHTSVHRLLEEMADESGETVTLSVRDGAYALTVDQVTPGRMVVSTNWIGMRTELHCTSDGKVLLAWLDEEEREALLAAALRAKTARTITDREALRSELATVRSRGYAVAEQELEEGLTGVAAPVRDPSGAVLAAISISGPSYRMTPAQLGPCVALAERLGLELGELLGPRSPDVRYVPQLIT
jgi:DNA-binding IclR family transcriptional regulator